MNKTTYCVVAVDTNDGDYEEYKTEITEENGDRLDEFTSLLQHPTETRKLLLLQW